MATVNALVPTRVAGKRAVSLIALSLHLDGDFFCLSIKSVECLVPRDSFIGCPRRDPRDSFMVEPSRMRNNHSFLINCKTVQVSMLALTDFQNGTNASSMVLPITHHVEAEFHQHKRYKRPWLNGRHTRTSSSHGKRLMEDIQEQIFISYSNSHIFLELYLVLHLWTSLRTMNSGNI
jgi:hypothetical protein